MAAEVNLVKVTFWEEIQYLLPSNKEVLAQHSINPDLNEKNSDYRFISLTINGINPNKSTLVQLVFRKGGFSAYFNPDKLSEKNVIIINEDPISIEALGVLSTLSSSSSGRTFRKGSITDVFLPPPIPISFGSFSRVKINFLTSTQVIESIRMKVFESLDLELPESPNQPVYISLIISNHPPTDRKLEKLVFQTFGKVAAYYGKKETASLWIENPIPILGVLAGGKIARMEPCARRRINKRHLA